jgi:uracil-DNA glycosylase
VQVQAEGTRVSMAVSRLLPHPLTGQLFFSPVPPGTGWPEDLAGGTTPIARTAAEVNTLAAPGLSLDELGARVSVCRACPRLVNWRETVAREKRRSFADQPYWGRPIPGWGDRHPRLLIVGLAPAANGANRTGRMFTGDRSGDWLFGSLYRLGLATQRASDHAGDGQQIAGVRMLSTVRCAPPGNKPTIVERDTCSSWLLAEWRSVLPSLRVVLALGGFGWDAVLRTVHELGGAVTETRFGCRHGARVVLQVPSLQPSGVQPLTSIFRDLWATRAL